MLREAAARYEGRFDESVSHWQRNCQGADEVLEDVLLEGIGVMWKNGGKIRLRGY